MTTVRALLMAAVSFKKEELRLSVTGGIVLPASMEGAFSCNTVLENPPCPGNVVGPLISGVIFMGWLGAVMTAF